MFSFGLFEIFVQLFNFSLSTWVSSDFDVLISIFDLQPICLICFQLWYLAQLITSFLLTDLFTSTFFACVYSHFNFACLIKTYLEQWEIFTRVLICESWFLWVTIASLDFYASGFIPLVSSNSIPSSALFNFQHFWLIGLVS